MVQDVELVGFKNGMQVSTDDLNTASFWLNSITISNVTITEGNDGAQQALFTVSRSGGITAFAVNYTTANGTATAGSDYAANVGTLNFGVGISSQTIAVSINGDTDFEPDETFFVNLSGATNGAVIADGQGLGTINNDDLPPVGSVSISDVTITEGDNGTQQAIFTVARSGGTAAFSVNYATANGTATAGSDYAANTGTLNFGVGVSAEAIVVSINGDTVFEPDETFFVNLSGATNGAVIADGQGLGTINNDDPPPVGSISISDVTITEGDNGTQQAIFTVARSGGTAAFAVIYVTANGTATAGSDYVPSIGTLNFGVGVITQTVAVSIVGDTAVEPDETFFVHLVGPTNGAVITDGQGLATIIDNETLHPDLTTSNISVSDITPSPGQDLIVIYQIANAGSAAADGFDAALYLSTDPSITTEDMFIGFQHFDHLAVNSFTTGDITAMMPATATLGATYYLGILVDNFNAIAEFNENNNTASIQITAEPDFTLIAQTAYFEMNLLPPSQTQVSNLVQFAAMQYAYGQQIGVLDPVIYMWQAFGLALCEDSSYFSNNFGPFAIQNDATFVAEAYHSTFGFAAGAVQIDHFVAQVDYFESIYTTSEAFGTDVAKISLLARGAVYGQMLGHADDLGLLI